MKTYTVIEYHTVEYVFRNIKANNIEEAKAKAEERLLDTADEINDLGASEGDIEVFDEVFESFGGNNG